MARAHLAKKLLLAAASPLVVLGLLEAALYLAHFRFLPPEAPIQIWNPVEDRALENQDGLFHREPDTLWSPRPGAAIPWSPGERVNPAGFRGPELPLERRPGVLRVATLGDSSTFGMGVTGEACYSAQLAAVLAEEGVAAEVLNAGVVAHTVRQGLERYRHHVRPYRPDVVVAAFGAVNEHQLAASMPDDDKVRRSQGQLARLDRAWRWALGSLHVPQFLAYLASEARGGLQGQRARFEVRVRREIEGLDTIGQIDWPGMRRVPLARYGDFLDELAREVAADGARLVVVVMPREPSCEERWPVLLSYSEATREAARRSGALLCDAHAAFRRAQEQESAPGPLFLPGDPWHPSAIGHGLLARELAPLVRAAAAARGGS